MLRTWWVFHLITPIIVIATTTTTIINSTSISSSCHWSVEVVPSQTCPALHLMPPKSSKLANFPKARSVFKFSIRICKNANVEICSTWKLFNLCNIGNIRRVKRETKFIKFPEMRPLLCIYDDNGHGYNEKEAKKYFLKVFLINEGQPVTSGDNGSNFTCLVQNPAIQVRKWVFLFSSFLKTK